MTAPSIKLSDVSVRYTLPTEQVRSVKDVAIRFFGRRRVQFQHFWALRHIHLDVHQGETVGITGPNGAGKSTLLKVVSRVLRPTEGRVQVWGNVAPLLELGAGFDYELTGRENIVINGMLLGYSKAHMIARTPAIVDFAGLARFIDAPVRTYSSGMVARLGFAIATDQKPEVLIVDEILSVGDADFQTKSGQRIFDFQRQGSTILVVSHSMAVIEKLASRVVRLEGGKVV
ncbi:MAG TPA: ABC transporter ATP-binding protein [Anaerolineales bacterium]|nr:ABC transporter ATP-binding protein [Anaerolineales bacterium]